jgi:hypothetical protein
MNQRNQLRRQGQAVMVPQQQAQSVMAVGGPANGQMLQMPTTPFAQQAIPAWGGGSAQQKHNALQSAYSQQQGGMAQAAPNNFGFQQQAPNPYSAAVNGAMQGAMAGMAPQQQSPNPYSGAVGAMPGAMAGMAPRQIGQQLYGIPSAVTQAAQSAYPFPSQAAQAASQNPYAMQNAMAAASNGIAQPIQWAGR